MITERFLMRNTMIVVLVMTVFMLVGGCAPPEPVDPQPPTPLRHDTSTNVSGAANLEDSPVMALVNGKPIYMHQLYDVLVRGQGLAMGQQLIVTEIVKQEADRNNVALEPQDIEREHQRMLADTFSTVEEPQQRERLLAQFLQEKQMPRVTWDMAVERNALLRKMVLPRLNVTDESLQREYTEHFGRRVQVRHIEVESLNEAQRMLNMLMDGEDFVELVRKYSKNPSAANGGLLPPISAASELPPAMLQVAMALSQEGQISSPVKVGYAFHILRLEKIIPAKNVSFEDARVALEDLVRQKMATHAQQQLLVELMRQAKYEYVDELIKQLDAADKNRLR